MDNKIVGVTIAIMIAIITLAGVMIPVINDAVATSDTFTNTGYYTLDKVESDTTISWAASEPTTIYINGDPFNAALSVDVRGISFVVSDKGILRLFPGADGESLVIRGYIDGYFSVSSANSTDSLNFTIGSDSITGTYNASGTESTKEITGSNEVYCANPNGNGAYVMKYIDESAYINADSEIIIAGLTPASEAIGIFGKGDMSGLTTSYFYNASSSPSIANMVIHTTAVSSHNDLYLLDKITFDLTSGSGESLTTVEATYSYFMVPTNVTADRAVPMDSAAAGILTVAPILIIVALLAMAAALVIRSRF